MAKLGGADRAMLLALRALAVRDKELSSRIVDTSLVITDPSLGGAEARRTLPVVREMIEGARTEIMLAGYALSSTSGIHLKLVEAARRGVKITVICGKWRNKDGGGGAPELLAKRPASANRPECFECCREIGEMHVKCIVVDSKEVHIGSANFTGAAMNSNVEMGLHVKGAIARAVENYLNKLARTTDFKKL